ncbi:hypothetical protein B0T21DRAFT_454298 [Apiosordaria backusii]|uniref:Uncharacterized protein n=1 Tax=Apiosordaria backusii TaxID=314023 RepID=A0AA40AIK1_9PEZI|nr:hypothetical protein B0T21DRAFT_454298 [Apiosordaria backusii]
MSGLYYVLMKWAPVDLKSGSSYGRYMICFPSRYDADEIYREMEKVPNLVGDLSRLSPQFWVYTGESLVNQIVAGYFSEHKNLCSIYLLPNADDIGGPPIIPNPVTGPDWLSDNTFFIRNRRQPNLYWFVHDTHIHTSEQRRTKFRIKQEISTGKSRQSVLIRKDKVTVAAVAETVGSAAVLGNGTKYVSIRKLKGKSNCLVLANTPHPWVFQDFIDGQVGVRWGTEIEEEKDQGAKPLVVFMPDGGGDEWELC